MKQDHAIDLNEQFSLKFCSGCLRKMCPNPSECKGNTARFFVSVVDYHFRPHIAYISIRTEALKTILATEGAFSADLKTICHILHVEQTDHMPLERKREVEAMYSMH